MGYNIYLPARIYSLIEGAKPINYVESLNVVNNCINVGNYYIPISSILFIQEVE